MFHEHDLLLITTKYRIIIQLGDRLREVKYDKTNQLGSLNGDRVRLIVVSYAAVLSVATQRSSPRDDTKNGCVGD